jgi:hypothetical protein
MNDDHHRTEITMDQQPGQEDGEDADQNRDPESSGAPVPDPAPAGPDSRLAEFAWDDSREAPRPSGPMALLVDELSGPGRRCPGANGDELVGLLRAWAAIESWAAAGKLGMIREIMRREAPPSPGADHGDLPEMWSASLRYELSGALACSTQSAETTASLAWQLGARLPHIGGRLEDGTLTSPKAKAIVEVFEQLTDPDAAAAEALIDGQLAGKTYTQVLRLAEQAALTVDPDLAERRREHAQKNYARVSFFRESAGTAGLSGRDLPPDEALAAMANVNARARRHADGSLARLRVPRPHQRHLGVGADRDRGTSRRRHCAGGGSGWCERGARVRARRCSSRSGSPSRPRRLRVHRMRRQLPSP